MSHPFSSPLRTRETYRLYSVMLTLMQLPSLVTLSEVLCLWAPRWARIAERTVVGRDYHAIDDFGRRFRTGLSIEQ